MSELKESLEALLLVVVVEAEVAGLNKYQINIFVLMYLIFITILIHTFIYLPAYVGDFCVNFFLVFWTFGLRIEMDEAVDKRDLGSFGSDFWIQTFSLLLFPSSKDRLLRPKRSGDFSTSRSSITTSCDRDLL